MKNDNLKIEELLNAYVDGELSVKERQRVEHLLLEDSEAQELFKQIQQVSQGVSALPVTAAPQELADNIQYELEREFLLGKEEVLSELAGEKHLQVRWLVSAAAVLVLAGVIVTVVYTVLNNPTDSVSLPEPPVVIIRPPDVLSGSDALAMGPPEGQNASDYPANFLNLIAQPLMQKSAKPTVEKFLEAHRIEQVIRNNSVSGATQFAFHCQIRQLTDLITRLDHLDEFRLDLQMPTGEADKPLTLEKVSRSQIMHIAALDDAMEQFAYISAELSYQDQTREKLAADLEKRDSYLPDSSLSYGGISFQRDLLQDWMDDYFVESETGPLLLRILGPEEGRGGKEITDPDILEAISANDPNNPALRQGFWQSPGLDAANEQSAHVFSSVDTEKMVAVVLICEAVTRSPDVQESTEPKEQSNVLSDPHRAEDSHVTESAPGASPAEIPPASEDR